MSAEDWQQASAAYSCLGRLLVDSGTEESVRKACSPDVKLIFLGVLFETSDMTLSVTYERLEELKRLLGYWLELEVASKKDMQSIIGKLNFVATCVRQRRVFIARLINHLKVFASEGQTSYNQHSQEGFVSVVRIPPIIQWNFYDGYRKMVTG